MTPRNFLRLYVLCAFSLCLPAAVQALEPVSLELRWFHQFQFAGYYAALEKGFYREAGLDVTLVEGGPGANPVQGVLSGRSDFGIALSSLVVNYLKGDPVLMLGPVFQHSPNILLVRGQDKRLVDLVTPRAVPIAVMGADQDVDLKSMFLNEGIALERLNLVADENHLADLLNGRVAALNAYASNEPYQLERLGVPYTVLKPSTYGLDFYGDVLFTRRELEQQKPEVVAAFYAASKRGWAYALAHPEEIADLILKRYNSQGKTREHLLYEARVLNDLVNPDVIEIGHSNPARWQHIAQTYARFGLVDAEQPLDDFFYAPEQPKDLGWLYALLSALAGVTLFIGSIAVYIHRTNRRLAKAMAEKERTEEALKKSEEWHRVVFETSPSAGVVWREGARVVAWNRQAEKMFGWRREEVMGRSYEEFLLPPNVRQELLPLLCAGEDEQPLLSHNINDNLTRDGRVITCEWFNAWLPERPGEPRCIISLATDITERQRLEAQIHQLAFYDPLTGLANRRLLQDRFQQTLALARRSGQFGALLFFDLDNFKPLNDRYGHAAGDQLLVQVAQRLQQGLRSCDSVARLGGDEFVVLLVGLADSAEAAREQAATVAAKLRHSLAQACRLQTGPDQILEYGCDASIGIALFQGQDQPEEILRYADQAMYADKLRARDRDGVAEGSFSRQ